jgi:hypothetical protein
MLKEPFYRPEAAPCQAFVDLTGLLCDMDVNGALSEEARTTYGLQYLAQLFFRNGTQRVWCDADRGVRISSGDRQKGVDDPKKLVGFAREPSL